MELKTKIIMKNSRKKFTLRHNESGFVFLELAVGLPLIIMLLWSMNNLFHNAWNKCNMMIVDFILQQEMHSVMMRIVDTSKIAYDFQITDNGQSLMLNYYEVKEDKHLKYLNGEGTNNPSDKRRYFKDGGKIYTGRTESTGNANPLTGDSSFGRTSVKSFKCTALSNNLIHIRLDAQSLVSKNNIVLTTVIYIKGKN